MRRLILIRHGQTHWNQQQRIHGWLDSALTPEAILQLQQLQLPSLDNPIVFTSDLARAEHSAEIIARRLTVPVTCDSRLRERNFGVLQGRVIDKELSLSREWALYHQRYTQKLSEISGVESETIFEQRILVFISDLYKLEKKRDIVIVGHGEWLRAFTNIIQGIPSWCYGDGVPKNATPVILGEAELALQQPLSLIR